MELQTRQGTIIHLNMKRRFGFLLTEDGRQVFFHSTGVVSSNFDELRAGVPVVYFEIKGKDSRPVAIGVAVDGQS